jgi:site-specific recombinase XerD
MMSTGTRVSGALLTWPQVDRANRVIRVRNKGKDGQQRWYMVPLTAAQLAILDECAGHHETHVFTYEEVRPGKDAEGRRLEPKRFPITDNGFKAHWRRKVREAGVAPGFRRHDTRHTAGTRLVRTTGNLKVAQRLLGHSRIETTTRYAHVMIEDVRAAMEAVENAHTAPTTHISAPTPSEKSKKKSG